MDLSFLKSEITFGTNKIFLGIEKFDFYPTYYCCANPLLFQDNIEAIMEMDCPQFFCEPIRQFIPDDQEAMFLRPVPGGFQEDISKGIYEGFTVTNVCLQVAFYMGFQEVYLIGIDHYYQTPAGMPNEIVTAEGADVNHFSNKYFSDGARWYLPDLENSEKSYRDALQHFQAAGRTLIDCTVEGKCTVFPKKDFREVFYGYCRKG
jgi:hypothetical protein